MARKALIGCVFFFFTYFAEAQVRFIIESLPTATPSTDTIFITGTFNDWVPDDPRYAVQVQVNGQLAVTIPQPQSKTEYKFTRGSWTKVETNAENNYTINREYIPGKSEKIYIKIENWLDLGGARELNYFIFYYFACAFQALALSLIVYRLHKKDDLKFKSLLIVNSVLIALLVLVIARETLNQVWHGYFVFLFHIGLFCWGPLLLFFISSFHTAKPLPKVKLYFLPAIIVMVFVIIRINFPAFNFLSPGVNFPLTSTNLLVVSFGFLYTTWMAVITYRQFSFLKPIIKSVHSGVRLSYYFFWTSVFALALLPLNVMVILSGVHHPFFDDFHVIAIILSALVFIETYFLWRYPEIIKEERVFTALSEDSQGWVDKVNNLMKEAKPYKNADLSVSDLAEMLGTKPHVLSKIINDSYHRNFRDFVNTYRIQEFIRLADTREFKHFTFLALAQEVGFNSKSTFNLAFKKFTNQSPRDYFKSKELT
jgi:AraC-like DNA-binding protein